MLLYCILVNNSAGRQDRILVVCVVSAGIEWLQREFKGHVNFHTIHSPMVSFVLFLKLCSSEPFSDRLK